MERTGSKISRFFKFFGKHQTPDENPKISDAAQLFSEAKIAFEANRHKLPVGDKPALPQEIHAEFATIIDKKFVTAIDTYLPHLLPYCESKMDIVASIAGLCYSGEIKGVPEDVLPFLGRGLNFAALIVAEYPREAKAILDSLDENGYPTGKPKSEFRSTNRFGEVVTCAGILSGVAAIRVFVANEDKIRRIHFNDKMAEDELKYLRV